MNPFLLAQNQAFINGQWVDAQSGQTYAIDNPATGQQIAEVPDMGTEDAELAIEIAHEAFAFWKTTTAKQRAGLLSKWFQLMVSHADDPCSAIDLGAGQTLSGSLWRSIIRRFFH